MESLWQKTQELPTFPSLEGDIKTDVLIIGGGLAGILTAHRLKEKGVECIVVEKGRICNGVTAGTTAKITIQHGLCYADFRRKHGTETAELYYRANNEALKSFEALCSKINCDYETKDNYVYSLYDRQALEDEADVLTRIGCNADFIEALPLPIKTVGAVRVKNQAQFHPLKFAAEIVKGLTIYENTFVKEIATNEAVTDKGKIKFKKVIVTTHFPFINNHGLYFMKLYQHRSYMLALDNAPNVNGMYVDENKKGMTFRNYKDMLIIGGGSHRTGKHGGNWKEIRDFARKNYPQCKETAYWAAQDCMSLDNIPYVGKYYKNSGTLYVASGFNKWGVTGSMVSAEILSDLITDTYNPYYRVFKPQRSILTTQLFINTVETLLNFITPTTKRCPHLGCALKWNKAEHSWDCPCHGSRFTQDGFLTDNPANGNLNIK